MRVLVTGHDGYIGAVLVPMLRQAGHDVHGLDSFIFEQCTVGRPAEEVPAHRVDIRDATLDHFDGFDAVLHLAALSNDPLGDLNPSCTFEINHLAATRVATLAKQAGVRRFLHASTCSLYGAHGEDYIDESAEFLPVTPYGKAKVLAEQDMLGLLGDDFSVTFLRNATAYGMSSRLRGDLVVNNLVGYACATGEVYMKSDGTPWRPLVHIEDISAAFLAILDAPLELVHGEAFNVGGTEENYQIRDVAQIVEEVVPGSRVVLADSAGPDLRNYRVNCDKIADRLGFRPKWTVRAGAIELRDAFEGIGLTSDELVGTKMQRIAHIRALQDSGAIDDDLRWLAPVSSGAAPEAT